MALAFFDMDGTLLDGDSNNFFFDYLLQRKVIDKDFLTPMDDFNRLYYEGKLTIDDFVYYAIKPILPLSASEREELIAPFVQDVLLPNIRQGALEAIKWHKDRGDKLFVVSATVDYLVAPVAKALGCSEVIAAPLEYTAEGRLTGKLAGPVPYQHNKVIRIKARLQELGLTSPEALSDSYAYGDSINDREMMNLTEHPVAVNPTSELKAVPEFSTFTCVDWGHGAAWAARQHKA